ncbi:glycosyl transferase family 1 [Burkholderia sp. PAMC 28687]|uniref:glycosyltransferase family 4 protein n=1 Tax=Burkholderia sp. PAMC 28687 TaxID=1795874 RepID=UPI0007839A72|nr:glycosyltransferase family 4 protein [Burkholderia sp. PAMC 28687]AMM13491.1 glycosyl transferase family 1 [Burkholderia sp. PAMC 28687]
MRAGTDARPSLGISANALKQSGGLERYALDLVRGLNAAGYAGERKPAFFARKIDTSQPESAMVAAHRINVSLLPSKLRDSYFNWALKRARKKAQVDVLIGCNRVESSEIAICGGTHIGFLAATGRHERPSDTRQIKIERLQYQQATVIVAHSEMMRDELRALYAVPDSKIRVLYPPVDGARFSPVSAEKRVELRKQFGFANNEIILLFPSSSHERKGLPLIDAALRDSGLPVVIAVAGRPPVQTSETLRYIGYAKNIEDAYRAADFTILASSYEPFGLVGIESVMCGTPVIFPTSIGCVSAIADNAKFTFQPGNADDLRRAVQRALAAKPANASAESILYDTSIAAHVSALLELAVSAAGSTVTV